MALKFAVNGEQYVLPPDSVDPSVTLNDFIRRNTRFTGTKLSCGEGGCGACAVDLAKIDPATGKQIHVSVNSCLRPLASMDGWAVTTTEGLGGPQAGYHPIQERIADFNGLQCGFCTPGMVMTTYSALKSADGDISMKDLEKRFDGNICRCTGYRPILDFCKSFANDSDIEDLVSKKANCCRHDCSSDPKFPEFLANHQPSPLRFEANGRVWIRPVNLAGLFDALDAPNSRVVIANTSTGIYKNETATVFVDAQAIPELLETSIGDDITIGGAVTVANFIALLQQAKAQLAGSFKANFLDNLITHAERVGNVHVRNVGSVAGNLILAKTKGFLSDLATILLGVQARVTVANRNGNRTVSLDEFLEGAELPRGEIVRAIHVPLATENAQFNSYKAALRPVNSHAYINAAFQVIVDGQTIQQAIIAFGGVLPYDVPGSRPILAKQTQAFLQGKPLNQETFKAALEVLKSEVQIQDSHKKAYRESLVAGFFYKFFVSLIGGDARVKSVTEDFFKTRPVSSGKQSFAYSNEHEPVSAPISKLSGKALASGDAKFVDDTRATRDTAFGAYITHTRARAKVQGIDVSRALQAPGVIGVVLAEDIPGPNTYSPMGEMTSIFENNFSEFVGQPAGLILADTLRHAEAAAKLAQISYEPEILLPVITVEQAQQIPEFDTGVINAFERGDYQAAIDNAPKKASGTVFLGSQQHFYMEPQTADATLDEDGTVVLRIASQWPAGTNGAVAAVLKLPLNKVRVISRRAGGGFGGKLSHHLIGGCAASVAALKFKQPVRITLNRNIDMALAGGREETTLNYTVGFNEEGKILGIILDGHLNSGAYRDLSWFCNMAFTSAISQTYELPAFKISTHLWKTNLPPRTAVRGPSEISGSYCIETVVERIAFELGLAPEVVRERNFFVIPDPSVKPALPNGSLVHDFTVPKMWEQVKQKFDAASLEAQVREFNQANRWKKQGFAITPVRYETTMFGRSATVSIFTDGSVIIHHGSSDIGQGLHVKVIQVVAHELGKLLGTPIPLELFRSGDNDTYIVPNATFTGGSTSSETAAEAARLASAELVLKLKPVLADLEAGAKERNEPFTPNWADLCNQAVNRFGLHLSAVGTFNPGMSYQNYGVCLSTVELDVITGDVEILRSHIIYDCGKSLNPAIDIGQAEGAYVMGLGFLLREFVDIAPSGELISNGTWEYKPPCFRDIPRVFSVDLLQEAAFDRGVLSSKASGEPPLVLANSVAFAVRHAIQEARREAGQVDFFDLPVPFTPDIIQQLCGVSPSQFQ